MHFQYVPYIWPLIGSAVITTALGVYALRHRNIRGALPFGICMLLTALWAAGYALEVAGADAQTVLIWLKVQSACYSLNPVIWLIMVFYFIERDRWINRRNILLLLVLPVLTVVVAWMNELHGWMWQSIRPDLSGAYPSFAKTFGTWFWVIAAYSYALNIISELLLAVSLRRKSALYREQAFALFVGLALLFAANALYIFRISPFDQFDPTLTAAGVSGIIIAWGIFRYRLFDIVPVARENIMENMADGLIVLDAQNRIADMNQTAKSIFGNPSMKAIGQKAKSLLEKRPAGAGFYETNLPKELTIDREGETKTYEISYLPLTDRQKKQNGLSVIFHDVTEKRKLIEQQKELALSLERERLVRDLHDNLGQVFSFINVQAQAIQYELENAGVSVAAKKLDRLIEAAQSAHQEIRTYIQSIKNTADKKDFISELKNELEQFKEQTGVMVRFDIPDNLQTGALASDAVQNILNIIKEALNNIRKHAQAKEVSVEIKTDSKQLLITISDNGKGFDISNVEAKPMHGLGLDIMKERAKETGGKLEIETSPGQGTSIKLSVPLRKE